jgi:hypothetical protein
MALGPDPRPPAAYQPAKIGLAGRAEEPISTVVLHLNSNAQGDDNGGYLRDARQTVDGIG